MCVCCLCNYDDGNDSDDGAESDGGRVGGADGGRVSGAEDGDDDDDGDDAVDDEEEDDDEHCENDDVVDDGNHDDDDDCHSCVKACVDGDEMASHRAEIVAQQAQHAEDRSLREQQDREYQEALEMDRFLQCKHGHGGGGLQ
eukprot:s1545_g7.t1